MESTFDADSDSTSFDFTEDTTVDSWGEVLEVVEEDAEIAADDIEVLYSEEEDESDD